MAVLSVSERALSQQWAVRVQRLENLIADIKSALNTEEDGATLVEVARNACRAEQELASLQHLETAEKK